MAWRCLTCGKTCFDLPVPPEGMGYVCQCGDGPVVGVRLPEEEL